MDMKDLMVTDVEVINPDTTIEEAATIMKRLDVGFLPVCENDRLVGVITDRDIVCRAIAEGLHSIKAKAASIMTPEVVYCYEDSSLDDAIKMMETKQVRRILVINSSKRLVGVASLGDIALRGRDRRITAEAVESISLPPSPAGAIEAA